MQTGVKFFIGFYRSSKKSQPMGFNTNSQIENQHFLGTGLQTKLYHHKKIFNLDLRQVLLWTACWYPEHFWWGCIFRIQLNQHSQKLKKSFKGICYNWIFGQIGIFSSVHSNYYFCLPLLLICLPMRIDQLLLQFMISIKLQISGEIESFQQNKVHDLNIYVNVYKGSNKLQFQKY